ncbi:MAG: hypothetical protein KYX64_07565 [Sphingopyxis sp.]|nr:hypothetical protein [Sphingopyxis sp.]
MCPGSPARRAGARPVRRPDADRVRRVAASNGARRRSGGYASAASSIPSFVRSRRSAVLMSP